MKPIVDYYIEFNHPSQPKLWQRTWDYYNSEAAAYSRIQQFKSMDYMRECVCRIIKRTQTFEELNDSITNQ